jgi:GxxExxY protein
MNANVEGLILKDEVYAIVGAAFDVHNELGAGFAEEVYQKAMEVELTSRGIPFERQKRLRINYKGQPLDCEYVADLVCFGAIIVELKAVRETHPHFETQIINYLKATGLPVGIIINFGHPEKLYWKRYARTH